MATQTKTKIKITTVTKKELIDRIADETGEKRIAVKRIVQSFLDEVVSDLGEGKRLEFRDFGVFEVRERKARIAQNPKTLEPVKVPSKWSVKFKAGRLMRLATERLASSGGASSQIETKPDPRAAAFAQTKPNGTLRSNTGS